MTTAVDPPALPSRVLDRAPSLLDLEQSWDETSVQPRPWQFQLRTLFIVVTVSAVLAGLRAPPGLIFGGGAVFLVWQYLHFQSTRTRHLQIAYVARRAALDRAKPLAQLLVDEYPWFAEGYGLRGLCAMREGRFEEAIADLNEALRLEPNSARQRMRRGTAYYWLNEYGRSVDDLNVAADSLPTSAWPLVARGNSLAMRGEYARAIDDYSRAIELTTQMTLAFENRALCRLETGDYAGAIADSDAALAGLPSSVEARCAKGRALLALGDIDGALTQFDDCLTLDPEHAAGWYYRARANDAAGRHDVAEADRAQAIALDSHLAGQEPPFEPIAVWLP